MNSILEIDGHIGTYHQLLEVPTLRKELLTTDAAGPDGIEFIHNLLAALGRGRIVKEVPDEPEIPGAIY